MDKRWINRTFSIILALALCIGVVPVTGTPAAAADVGSNEWVVRNDDFSDYPVGLDAFWQNERYSGFYNSSHGIYGGESYSTYDIVEENGNKMLQLVSMNRTANYFDLPKVSGAWSVSMDLYMLKSASSVPGISLQMFHEASPSMPNSAIVYVEPYGFRLVEYLSDGTKHETYVTGADGKTMTFPYNTWYTLKVSLEPGKLTVKAWPQGGQEPGNTTGAGVIVFEHEAFTEERLNNGMVATIANRSRNYADVTQTTRLDNLKITKPFDTMDLPTALQGTSGDRLAVEASFTGQDLNAQVPAPRFRYTFSDPDMGRAGPGDYLILGDAGQGTVTVELADMDGKGTGVTQQIPLSVAQAIQGERPLRILSIGNGYSRDSLYYLSHLANLVGEQVEFAYLYQEDATLRYHAHNVAMQTADYSYYVSDPETGAVTQAATGTTINEVVNGQNWDVVVLQQGGAAVGMNNTFAGDLRYLLDYLSDAQPNAKVYWNMNTADQQDTATLDGSVLKTYYDGNQSAMYNAIVGCLDMFIVGADAEYAADFDGWFPVGAVIQDLRTDMGDALTRDGVQLSLQAGRLTAAMTVLKVLFPDADLTKITPDTVSTFLVTDKTDDGVRFAKDPDYTNNAANMALIRQSVEAACADLNKAPTKIAVSAKTIESVTKDPADVTVGQTDAPLNLRFADIVVTKDGTVYAGAYESVTHVPARGKLPYTEYCPEGYGRLKIWKSMDNGKTWDFDNPILTIDQHELDDWGVSPGLYNRYERLKNGARDYAFFNDARDANLGLMYHDMDGNGTEEEVLMFTFFCNDYNESGTRTFRGTFILHSVDGGKTWSVPQRIVSKVLGNGGGKRGDMAVFSNGQLLFPMYSHPKVAGVLLQWNVKTQRWDTIADTEIPNYVPEKTTDFTEPSFIAPDPDGDTVYGFVRDNGQAVVSYDRGRTWEHIHTIDGNVQQPGWAYIDENRTFATWSFSNGGVRPTKGQMVYFDAGWEATQPKVVHEHYNPVGRDTGDPSAKLLQNGKLLAITYDTYFRAINGRFIDPNAPEFQLPELCSDAAEVTLHEVTPTSVDLTVGENLPFSHTVNATATFTAGGALTVTAANGAVVEFGTGKYGISANRATELRIAVVSGVTYIKVWPMGGTEPENWTAVQGGTDQNSGKAVFTGSGVTLSRVKITRRATLTVEQGEEISAGMTSNISYTVTPADMADKIVWTTSDAGIATVDAQGKVTFKGEGTVTITASIADKSGSATYEVLGISGEAAGVGKTKVLFADDFENYDAGTDAFIDQMVSHGYEAMSTSVKVVKTGYHIVEQDGNQYLELVGENGKYAWCVVDTPISGDYTVQFDFLHKSDEAGKGTTYFNLWQTTGLYAMVQMPDDHLRVQHIDAGSGLYSNSKIFYSHDYDIWNTMKIARVDGGVYIKVWPQGTPEPEHWQFCALAEEMTTDNTAKFRFSSAADEDEVRSVLIDNLLITKQKVPNALGTNEWVVRSDDFNDRVVGKDTFWNDARYGAFTERNHVNASDHSYYGVVEENGNRMVELVTGKTLYNVFATGEVTGAYSTTVDIYMKTPTGTSNPGIILNPFYGTELSGKAAVYIDGNDGVRLREFLSTGSAVNTYVKDENDVKIPFKNDTWYTVKVSVEPGQITVKTWPQGGQEPAGGVTGAGVYVFEHDTVTADVLNGGAAMCIQTRSRPDGAAYVVRLDNMKLSKPYKDLKLPKQLSGKPGETVTLDPKFTGQNLAALTPAPKIKYSTSDSAVASVTAGGVVTFGAAGEGKIFVELLDIDGKSNGIAKEIPVMVEGETKPEPEVPSTLGTFSLEVVNYVIINGEEVAICRWVWTPLNRQ